MNCKNSYLNCSLELFHILFQLLLSLLLVFQLIRNSVDLLTQKTVLLI